MKKSVLLASVCAVFLATGVAATGVAAAETLSSSVVMQQAYANLVSGKADEAVAGYTSIIDNPDTPVAERAMALLNRALGLQKLERYEDAVADYSSALRLNALNAKTRAVALYNRGLAHVRLNNNFASVDDFTNALYLDPHMAEAFYSRANALRESGQYEYALIDYSRAISAGYRHEHLAWYGKALTFKELGHKDEATAAFLRAYAIKPDFKPTREQLSELGVDAPANPTERQIKLAVLPAQNLMADSIVTGTTQSPAIAVAKAERKEPVAPPPSLLSRIKPDQPGVTVAAAERATPVKPLPQKPEAISVADGGPVPESSTPVVEESKSAQAVAAMDVRVEPVSAPAPETGTTNLAQHALDQQVSEKLEGWTVQLVSQRDAASAWQNWDSIKARHGSLLDGAEAAVVKADLGDQGIYFRLRVHKLESKQDAASLCRNLKRKGTNCFVARAS